MITAGLAVSLGLFFLLVLTTRNEMRAPKMIEHPPGAYTRTRCAALDTTALRTQRTGAHPVKTSSTSTDRPAQSFIGNARRNVLPIERSVTFSFARIWEVRVLAK